MTINWEKSELSFEMLTELKTRKPPIYNLFVYGTLKHSYILESVLERKYEGDFKDAVLPGFIRLQPSFYMIFEDEGSQVEGKLVSGITASDLKKLDRYEGVASKFYRRKSVTAKVNGENVKTWVYHNGPSFKKEDYM